MSKSGLQKMRRFTCTFSVQKQWPRFKVAESFFFLSFYVRSIVFESLELFDKYIDDFLYYSLYFSSIAVISIVSSRLSRFQLLRNSANRPRNLMSAVINGIYNDSKHRAKMPDDCHSDPTAEEALCEDPIPV